jgi:hypothetical protein
VAFDEDPAFVAMDPAMGNPVSMGMGWALPATGNPDVAIAVPAVVAIDPDEFAAGGDGARFNDGGGWSDTDNDLRKGRSRQQSYSKQQSWNKLLHGFDSLMVWVGFAN